MEKQRKFDVQSSQAIKGIAIIMMMQHHCFREQELYQGYEISFFPFQEQFVVELSYMFKICVSLFAFITGYGLYLNYKKKHVSSTKWVLIREVKVLSGYWFVFICSVIICQLLNGRTYEVYFFDQISKGIVRFFIDFIGCASLFDTRTLNGTWWYMSAAVVFVICIPLFMKFEEQLPLVLMGVAVIPRVLRMGYLGDNAVYTFLSPLILGMIMAKYNLVERWINYGNLKCKIAKLVAEVLFLCLGYGIYVGVPNELICEYKFGLYPLVVILFVTGFIINIPFLDKVLGFLGKHSMNIFLTHTFIRAYYLEKFIYSLKHFILIILVLLLMSLGISIILERLKGWIGYNKWINALCKKIENTSIKQL